MVYYNSEAFKFVMRVALLFVLVHLTSFVSSADKERTEGSHHGTASPAYTADDFEHVIPTKPHLVMFFAPWCGHCQRLAPVYEKLAEKYNIELMKERVIIAKVDCTVETALCSDSGIKGYPTILFFWSHPKITAAHYKGNRDLLSLEKFVEKMLLDGPPAEKEVKEEPSGENKALIELTDADFDSHISTGYHFVKFYAPWCGHCKKLIPIWDKLAVTFQHDSSVSIAKIDCTQFGDICKRFSVRGYPTLLFFGNGKKISEYSGSRSHKAFVEFVKKTKEQDGDEKTADSIEIQGQREEEKEMESDGRETPFELTDATFGSHIAVGHHFVKFYAPWCGHCKNLAPTWDKLAYAFQGDNSVTIAKIDCTKFGSICKQYSIRGYPTLLFISNGQKITQYSGQRGLSDLKEFVDKTKADQDNLNKQPPVITLDESSFEVQLMKGHTFVNFFKRECEDCIRLKSVWLEMGKKFQSETGVVLAEVDCTVDDYLCRRNGIDDYPTLILYYEGDRLGVYTGPHDQESLSAFLLMGLSNPQALLQKRDEL